MIIVFTSGSPFYDRVLVLDTCLQVEAREILTSHFNTEASVAFGLQEGYLMLNGFKYEFTYHELHGTLSLKQK